MDNKTNDRVVIIDAFNLFIRNYVVNPAIASNGEQAGGVVGFLRSLTGICEKLKPTELYIIWESGGSPKRRAILSSYKSNRRPIKLNRNIDFHDVPDTEQNKFEQVKNLVDICTHLPIKQVYVHNCEADDVIAYICRYKKKNETKIIVSSDHDFYQLVDDKTTIYQIHKKKIMDEKAVLDETGITAKNFSIAKAFVGDKSDNIDGIKGVGFKTLATRFPDLASDKELMLSDIISIAEVNKDKGPALFKHIYEGAEIAHRNWKLMYLDNAMLSHDQLEKIDTIVENNDILMHKIDLLKQLIKVGLQTVDVDSLCTSMVTVKRSKQ